MILEFKVYFRKDLNMKVENIYNSYPISNTRVVRCAKCGTVLIAGYMCPNCLLPKSVSDETKGK